MLPLYLKKIPYLTVVVRAAVCSLTVIALGSCSSGPTAPSRGMSAGSSGQSATSRAMRSYEAGSTPSGERTKPRGGGSYKVGTPYQIRGRWYVPREDSGYDRVGAASWYGPDFHGKRTANGETFDMYALTAAHKTLPLPSYVYVTNLENGRTLLLRVNDRGPYVDGRVIDLSLAAATALGYAGQGLAQVRVRYAGRAPLDGSDSAERQHLARQTWSRTAARSQYR